MSVKHNPIRICLIYNNKKVSKKWFDHFVEENIVSDIPLIHEYANSICRAAPWNKYVTNPELWVIYNTTYNGGDNIGWYQFKIVEIGTKVCPHVLCSYDFVINPSFFKIHIIQDTNGWIKHILCNNLRPIYPGHITARGTTWAVT